MKGYVPRVLASCHQAVRSEMAVGGKWLRRPLKSMGGEFGFSAAVFRVPIIRRC